MTPPVCPSESLQLRRNAFSVQQTGRAETPCLCLKPPSRALLPPQPPSLPISPSLAPSLSGVISYYLPETTEKPITGVAAVNGVTGVTGVASVAGVTGVLIRADE